MAKKWLNRFDHPLPEKECIISIIYEDFEDQHEYICKWHPYNPNDYVGMQKPSEGYLGTARVISGDCVGIGFNAWAQSVNEFVYYRKKNQS